jgi:hypothetical protein
MKRSPRWLCEPGKRRNQAIPNTHHRFGFWIGHHSEQIEWLPIELRAIPEPIFACFCTSNHLKHI